MTMKTLLLLVLSCFLFACSDNLFDGNVSNDDSNIAKTVELEKALDKKDYDFILSRLSNASGDYTGLTTREQYLLQMAWLGKTGFNTLEVIDYYFNSDAEIAQILLKSLGGGEVNGVMLSEKRGYYAKVIGMTGITDSKDIAMAGGMAGALDTLIILSDLAYQASGSGISFDPDDPLYIGKIFEGKADTEIAVLLTPYVESITSNVNALGNAVDSILVVDDKNGNIKEKLNDFISEITEAGGVVTEASIIAFIRNGIQ